MSEYQYEKYLTTPSELRETLETFGVAIIPSVLSEEECSSAFSGMWDFLEYITQKWKVPISRKKKESWKGFYSLFPLHSMLIQYFSIGHFPFAWEVRKNEKILSVFAELWGCEKEDLLSSFDGSSFSLPPEVTGRGWDRGNEWFHTDQSFSRDEFDSVQSFVSLLDTNIGDATLSFLEGSNSFHHTFYEEYLHSNADSNEDWYKLNTQERKWFLSKGCTPHKIMCKKGDLVLWDSRTIHCGVEPQKKRKELNFRAVVYCCYTPKEWSTPSSIAKKRKAFIEGRTTSHYPHKIKLFPKTPRTYGKVIEEITPLGSPKKLYGNDAVILRLAGFDE